jgi:glutaconate CoA-transferase subunit B
VEQVVENTGFELIIRDDVSQNPLPSAEELRILRDEVDRERLYI